MVFTRKSFLQMFILFFSFVFSNLVVYYFLLLLRFSSKFFLERREYFIFVFQNLNIRFNGLVSKVVLESLRANKSDLTTTTKERTKRVQMFYIHSIWFWTVRKLKNNNWKDFGWKYRWTRAKLIRLLCNK